MGTYIISKVEMYVSSNAHLGNVFAGESPMYASGDALVRIGFVYQEIHVVGF